MLSDVGETRRNCWIQEMSSMLILKTDNLPGIVFILSRDIKNQFIAKTVAEHCLGDSTAHQVRGWWLTVAARQEHPAFG
jgi:hypothetical protein